MKARSVGEAVGEQRGFSLETKAGDSREGHVAGGPRIQGPCFQPPFIVTISRGLSGVYP